MIKRRIVLILLLVVFWGNAFPQTLSNQVLLPAAGLVLTSTLEYSQSIGETAVEIISGSGFEFTQGFQQPAFKIQDDYNINVGTGVEAYPNPATDYIDVKLFGQAPRRFRIELININGTIVKNATIDFITTYYYVHRINIDNLLRGLYYVRVLSMDGVFNRSFKIEKI